MLSAADEKLVRREAHLPGLALLLEGGAIVEALQPVLPEQCLSAAEPLYVRYKPGTNCLAGYRFTIEGEEYLGYAKAFRRDDEEKIQKALRQEGTTTCVAPAHVLLVQDSVAVFFFPNDYKLRALRRLSDEAQRVRLFEKLIPGLAEPASARLQTLRYKPERRYVARVDQDGPVAVLKWYAEGGYEAARVRAAAIGRTPAVRTPRLIGTSSRRQVLAFEWIPGQPLNEAVMREATAATDVAAAAAALAELHGQEPDAFSMLPPAEADGALFAAADGVVAAGLAAQARSLAHRLATRLGDGADDSRPIHGDFYTDQVLIDGDSAALIDFDRSGLGDPAADLGNFIAHLEHERIRGHLTKCRTEMLREALFAGYRAQGGRISETRVAQFAAAGLLQLAPQPFRLREADWTAQTEALLLSAEKALAEGAQFRIPTRRCVAAPATDAACSPAENPYGASSDPSMPFVRQALQTEGAATYLGRALSQRHDARVEVDLRAIRVLRHKPGRRCLIAYELSARQEGGAMESISLLGKVRAKGLDRTSYEVQQSLWHNGFATDSPDGVSVPEPVALVPELNMWLQRKVRGVTVTERLAGPEGPTLSARVARALHKLHGADMAMRRVHTLQDELIILHERLTGVADEVPAMAGRIAGVLERCCRLADSMPQPTPQPIHRDFYADNVLVAGERLYFIDFDLACKGDPAVDAGNFIAHVTEQSLRCLGDAEALRPCEAAFEDAFVACHGEAVRMAVRAYTTLTLARHISISTRMPERRPFTEALVALCEQRLEQQASWFGG